MLKGEIDIEEQVEGTKIFMFNIHSDAIMIPIYLARKGIIYQKMIDEGEIEDFKKYEAEQSDEEEKPKGTEEQVQAEGG